MCSLPIVFCFKQKTAYELRISDWSSDVCSSDLDRQKIRGRAVPAVVGTIVIVAAWGGRRLAVVARSGRFCRGCFRFVGRTPRRLLRFRAAPTAPAALRTRATRRGFFARSEEHTSELQSLMRNSYAVFCLKKKKTTK